MITYKYWRQRYVRPYQDGLYVAYNSDGELEPADAVTVSEASGYGLLASLLADERSDFDKFLSYYNEQTNDQGLACWQQVLRGNKIFTAPEGNARSSATDGDMDAAYALLLAGQKWNDSSYTERGKKVCAAIWEWSVTHETFITNLGDWCKTDESKGADDLYWTSRTSDYMLCHFQIFSEVDKERSSQWATVTDATVQVLQRQYELHPDTGLVADFLVYNQAEKCYKPAQGKVLERESDGEFGYNACRLPWRVAMWFKQTGDKRVLPLLQAQQKFFEGQKFISAGYSLDGKPGHKYTNICFLAPILILFKIMDSKKQKQIEDAIHKERDEGRATYFGESIELVANLQLQELCNPANLPRRSKLATG